MPQLARSEGFVSPILESQTMAGIPRYACLLLLAILATTAGCSNDASNPTAAATAKPATADATKAAPVVTQTPEEAVQTVMDGLKASKPVVVWDTLPSASQRSLDDLIAKSAGKIDSEVWQQTVVTLKKLLTLMETKKDFILASTFWKMRQLPKVDDVKPHYDPAVRLLRAIVESELADKQKMMAFNGHDFLAGSGAKIMKEARAFTKTMKPDPLAIIDTSKVTVKKQSDSSAKLTITPADPKQKPIELSLTVVDGKWTASQFQMGANLAGLFIVTYLSPFRPYQLVEWKAGYLKDMDRLGKIIDKLQATKTSDEFEKALTMQALPFLMAKSAQLQRKGPKPTEIQNMSWDRNAKTSMVIVKGLHTFDEPTYQDLTKSLRAIPGEDFRGPLEVEGSTLFFIGPTDSVFDKTVEAIKVGKIVAQDKLRETVTVELPTSLKDEKATAEAETKPK
jgi:hypothetical protein